MSGGNNFSGEGQGKIHHVVVAKEKLSPLPKKIVVPGEKVTPSEEILKGTNILNDMEESVVMIHRVWITCRGVLQHKWVGLILILSG